jgi:putative ABC transport system permease protein
MRSSLTILGVVIGVATVMAMAAIVEGIRNQIVSTIEIAGPTTFYVMKKFSQTPLNRTTCRRTCASARPQ